VIVRSLLLLAWLTLLAPGCPSGDDDDCAADDDSMSDDDVTDDGGMAVQRFEGTATVDGTAYAGTEALILTADQGAGAELCRIEYVLTSTAVRDDCGECLWAFDLALTEAIVTRQSGVGCEAFGYDAAAVAALGDAPRSYGYAEEYLGHANMLMYFDQSWQALSFATFSLETNTLAYGWDDAYVPY